MEYKEDYAIFDQTAKSLNEDFFREKNEGSAPVSTTDESPVMLRTVKKEMQKWRGVEEKVFTTGEKIVFRDEMPLVTSAEENSLVIEISEHADISSCWWKQPENRAC